MLSSMLAPIRFLRLPSAGVALAAAALLTGCSDSATSPSAVAKSEQLTSAVDQKASPRRVITLRAPAKAAFPLTHGKATFRTGGQRELEIEIEDARVGLRVVFFLGTQRLGARTVNALHRASIDLRGVASPASVAGKVVKVKTAAGIVVVSGQF